MIAELIQIKALLPYFFLIGALSAYIAQKKKGRNPIAWFFIGFFFGILGFSFLFFLPKKKGEKLDLVPAFSYKRISSLNKPWYFLDESHKVIGPVSFDKLLEDFEYSLIHEKTYLWNENMENWKPLEELEEVTFAFKHESIKPLNSI